MHVIEHVRAQSLPRIASRQTGGLDCGYGKLKKTLC